MKSTKYLKNTAVLFFIIPLIIPLIMSMAAFGAANDLDDAYKHLKAKDYKKAIGLFEAHLEKKPGDARIHLETGYVYLKIKNDEKALGHFLKHLELTEAKPKVKLEVAYLYLRLKNNVKAERFFRSYLESEPGNLDVSAELAFLLLKLDKKQEAIRRMKEILTRDPGRETIRLNLAYLLMSSDSSDSSGSSDKDEAYRHFKILSGSKDREIKEKADAELKYRPRAFGYMFEGILYHSFRFDINVLSLNARVYYRRFPLRFLEPYLFMQMSTDAESSLNPFPTIYSEQAVFFGAGLQWYPYKRNIRVYAQYGYIKKFLEVPGWESKKYTFSYGIDSFFRVPLGNGWGLELNNSLGFHSRFDDDWLFYGKEIIYNTYTPGNAGIFRPYAGVVGRWDSKNYFYNNNLELIAGLRWTLSTNFTWYAFAEYSYGNYFKNTFYGKDYHELIVGVIVGIYK